MGAYSFATSAWGKDAAEAFRSATEHALWEHGHACSRCAGTGVDPEEFRLFYVEELAQNGPHVAADVAMTVLDWVRNHRWNRADAEDRRMLRAAARLLKAQRS